MSTPLDPSIITILHTGYGDHPDRIAFRRLKFDTAPSSLDEAGSIAFEVTNSPFVMNLDEELTIEKSGRCYSTSVGDVIEWNGRLAIVVSDGFMEISTREYNRAITEWYNHIEAGVTFRYEFAHHGVRKIKVYRKTMTGSLDHPHTLPGDETLTRI